MSAKTEACWDRTEGCCMTDAFERGMRRPKRVWGDAPGMTRMSRLGEGWIVACRICPRSSTGAPRNFAWPKGDLTEALSILSAHFEDEHPLRFAPRDPLDEVHEMFFGKDAP